ncbi:hypothetical protein GGR61_003771 [Xanthomonas arboricola]|nr:hypothetical protein [Xanthomonas sp. 3058]
MCVADGVSGDCADTVQATYGFRPLGESALLALAKGSLTATAGWSRESKASSLRALRAGLVASTDVIDGYSVPTKNATHRGALAQRGLPSPPLRNVAEKAGSRKPNHSRPDASPARCGRVSRKTCCSVVRHGVTRAGRALAKKPLLVSGCTSRKSHANRSRPSGRANGAKRDLVQITLQRVRHGSIATGRSTHMACGFGRSAPAPFQPPQCRGQREPGQ